MRQNFSRLTPWRNPVLGIEETNDHISRLRQRAKRRTLRETSPVVDYVKCPNLLRLFFDQAEKLGDTPFMVAKKDGTWQPTTWRQAADTVRLLARGLASLGIARGDRIGLVAENRPEWLIADLAIMAAGAITVPAYTTNTVADHRYILSNVGAKAVIASNAALSAKAIEAARDSGPSCKFVVAMEMPNIAQHPGIDVHAWDSVRARGQQAPDNVDAMVASLQRTDIACVIHTSGTGGLPRGVMLAHGSILCNAMGADDFVRMLGGGENVFLCFLPLSHAYEHSVCVGVAVGIGATIHFAESLDKLSANMVEVRPTLMTAVPRLYEAFHQRVLGGLAKASPLKQKMFGAALALGTKRYRGESLGLFEALADRVLDKLVRDKVRARFGGRLKAFVSGGAALNPEIGVFFQALGVRVLQGYGQTEAGPVVSCNQPFKERMDTVGIPLKGVEVRIAEDGEILVRGELVMAGYWNDPVGTAQTVRDGWLHTGDIGFFDAQGRLGITDRKRDFIKNSGGDMIAPSKVEGVLLLEPEIAQAMVVGDGKPYLSAVLVARPEATGPDNPRAALDKAVERANAKLALPERVRKFVVALEPFTIENAQMTPTLKVRRHVVRELYAGALEALYK
jgi:long-chain acyl-CoA synthetase